MKANEIITLDELSDQVSFEDCMVRKVDPGKNSVGNKEMDGYFRITTIHRDDLKEDGFEVSNVNDEQIRKASDLNHN